MNMRSLCYKTIFLLSNIGCAVALRASSEIDLTTQEEQEGLTRGGKCKKFRNVTVCNTLKAGEVCVAGNETVNGTLTVNGVSVTGNATVAGVLSANSITTSSGPLVSGIRNYAVFLNALNVPTDTYVLWGDTSAFPGNVSAGITYDTSTGYITLPVGIFLVQYTVRFTMPINTPSNGTAYATLQQGPATGPIAPSSPIAISGTYGSTDAGNHLTPQVTGYALITVTSAVNNTIGLYITMTGFNLQGAEGDENAELVVLQLN